MAAGLALALAATLVVGHLDKQELRTRLQTAEASNLVATRGLAVCQATNATLENTLKIVDAGRAKAAGSRGLTLEELLARPASGADACARAMEAEALVREAAR